MKNHLIKFKILLVTAATSFAAVSCSTVPGQTESAKEIAATGPTVLNAYAEPDTVDLNRDLQAKKPPEIVADVKDFGSKITDVRLKFLHVPIQVPMENIGGTTWRARLSPRQLQMLAVSGKTIKYDATVVAKDAGGQVAESQEPLTVSIKAPDISDSGRAASESKKSDKAADSSSS